MYRLLLHQFVLGAPESPAPISPGRYDIIMMPAIDSPQKDCLQCLAGRIVLKNTGLPLFL